MFSRVLIICVLLIISLLPKFFTDSAAPMDPINNDKKLFNPTLKQSDNNVSIVSPAPILSIAESANA